MTDISAPALEKAKAKVLQLVPKAARVETKVSRTRAPNFRVLPTLLMQTSKLEKRPHADTLCHASVYLGLRRFEGEPGTGGR